MEILATGFQLAEAPRPAPGGGLYFSDVLGGGVRLLRPDGELEVVVPKRRGVGGLVPHRDGGLVVSGTTVEHVRDGERRVLLELEGISGFNDLTTDSEGRVIVGALRFFPFRDEDPVPSFVWRIEPDGEATLLAETIRWPNGTAVSPDGSTLYMSDYSDGTVHAFELDAEPPLPGRVFASSPRGSADGLTVDAEGGVWVALGEGAGLARLAPDGELDRIVDIPDAFVTSLCFDGRDAYVTTADSVLRTQLGVSGRPAVPASV
jgi:sugar lactone lactonase YvrE